MNTVKEIEEFMDKYVQYCNYNLPRIFFNFFQNKNERNLNHYYVEQINSMINPVNIFSNFSSLSVFDPTTKPVIIIDPNKEREDKVKNSFKGKNNSDYNHYNRRKFPKQQEVNHSNHSNYYETQKKSYQKPQHKENYFKSNNRNYNDKNMNKETIYFDNDDKSVHSANSGTVYKEDEKEDAAGKIFDVVEKKISKRCREDNRNDH